MAELLIVVAIIAVLVAVAIPVFNNQLEKSRRATAIANLRSSYGVASAAYLVGDDTDGVTITDHGEDGVQVIVDGIVLPADLTEQDGDGLPFVIEERIGKTDNDGVSLGFWFSEDGNSVDYP